MRGISIRRMLLDPVIHRAIVSRPSHSGHHGPLFAQTPVVTVLNMLSLARLLQLIGLTIPPLAIIAQLTENISLGQMLGFLVVSIAVFCIGYLMQAYSGGGRK